MAVAGDTGDRRKGISPLDSIREFLELEAGKRLPNFETFQRICKLYWPRVRDASVAAVAQGRMLVLPSE